ncbi:hypothetical protein HG535_0A04430 [Zygotorulaspora mrakii]|uniref:Synaptonemal complex protein ZIP1 n=1 Tax=Zygotorulaspora mrakii TaxID=42260 RepID=A0A7H9AWA3_ZYGMR|nr:uncharacterized protein HG535_0A04430 [Zygotorulaspora mrakii]QLG70503.1 hypothetical protein HG535_0A04430 [Zygotorulaspora mrakii]
MSNFFRDNSLGFKPRSNIFSKLRVKEPDLSCDSSFGEDAGSSLMRDVFMKSHQKNVENTTSDTTVAPGDQFKPEEHFQLGSSTPKAFKSFGRVKGHVDEDDLEITEVRDVLGPNDSSASTLQTTSDEQKGKLIDDSFIHNEHLQPVDTSSNDVLLEAFTNTQKICSNLKQELQRQQTQNSKLKEQVSNSQNENKKLVERFEEYKQLLTNLEDQSKSLQDQKSAGDTTLKELKESHCIFEKKIDEYKKLINGFKLDISNFKLFKKDVDLEASKKLKEIEYLKRELNDCSGHLSEEKLKNISLLQELSKSREEIRETIIAEVTKGEHKLQDALTSFNESLNATLQEELRIKLCPGNKNFLDRIFGEITKLEGFLKSKMEDSTNLTSRHVQDKFASLNEQLLNKISEENERRNKKASESSEEFIRGQNKYLKECLGKYMEQIQAEMSSMGSVSLSSIESLTQSFEKYQAEMKNCQQYKSKISELQSEVQTLQLHKSQVLSSLGTKEAQHEQLVKKLNSKNIEISKYVELRNQLRQKVDVITTELEYHKNRLVKLNEENITIKANSENKIIVQGELLKALQTENDIVKQRTVELDTVREQNEKENINRIAQVQSLNEKLQRLNVEMVQLKAHELELEEENRNLKNSIEDDKASYDETTGELNLLQQRLIVLQADKQDVVTEKLDLQDKIDELRSSLKNMKQKIKTMENDNVTSLEDQKKKLGQGSTFNPRVRVSSIRSEQVEDVSPDAAQKEVADKGDEFDLSSSLNDDLELTNPSPIEIKTINLKKPSGSMMKPPNFSKKKLLLLDDDDSATHLKHRWKKRRA